MPAMTYSPTHLARAVPSALRGLTSVFGMGTGGTPAVRSPTSRSRQLSAVSHQQIHAGRSARAEARQSLKELEDDASQLNRLGRRGKPRLYYKAFLVGAQLSVLLLSHPGSDDIQTNC